MLLTQCSDDPAAQPNIVKNQGAKIQLRDKITRDPNLNHKRQGNGPVPRLNEIELSPSGA
jgi:hypothetical protein